MDFLCPRQPKIVSQFGLMPVSWTTPRGQSHISVCSWPVSYLVGCFSLLPVSNWSGTINESMFSFFLLPFGPSYLVLSDYDSNWTTFLEKNYTQFKQKNTTAYLATVVERSHSRSRSVGSHLILDIGNGSTWEGYNNGPLDAGAEY